jgi:hypothetical protein
MAMPRLPKRYPEGTKYVVEAHGDLVRRYVELPDGRRVRLRSRKPFTLSTAEPAVSLAPDHDIGNERSVSERDLGYVITRKK